MDWSFKILAEVMLSLESATNCGAFKSVRGLGVPLPPGGRGGGLPE